MTRAPLGKQLRDDPRVSELTSATGTSSGSSTTARAPAATSGVQ